MLSGSLVKSLFFVLLSSVAFTACETTIDPIDRTRGFYSIYGALDLHSDLNYVRVKDLNHLLLRDSTRNLNAEVSLINQDNSTADVLEDHVVEFDSVYTHNFTIPYRIQTATRYRLLIEGADGGTAWADFQTPDFAEVSITPERSIYSCTEPVEFTVAPVLSGEPFLMVAIINDGGDEALVHYQEEEEEEVDDKELALNFGTIENLLQRIERLSGGCGPGGCDMTCSDLSDNVIYLAYKHSSAGFFEQTTLDTTSVTGGAGRFGAFYRDTMSFVVDTSETSPASTF